MKVTNLIRREHEAVKALFAKVEKAQGRQGNGRREAFEELRRELSLHSQIESEIFYSALENTASTRATELLAEARTEHERVETLMDELSSMNASDTRFDSKFAELTRSVEAHVEKEEEEIFEEARQFLPEYRLEELGLEMESRRRILTQLAA